MDEQAIHIKSLPELKDPILIIGFDGWGNAMNISKGMVVFLIRKLNGKEFATLNPDCFYRYDAARPWVNIEQGVLESVTPPGGSFYAIKTDENSRDIVVLKAEEPNLKWFLFTEELLNLCKKLEIKTIITLGSMFDNVLHTDKVISGITTNQDYFTGFSEKNVNLIYYHGPSSIHSIIQSEGSKSSMKCISLWCHCPYYLQDTVHFGLISHLGEVLSYFGKFQLDRSELEKSWEKLKIKIEVLLKDKPELQAVVEELQKEKVKTIWGKRRTKVGKNEKIINLKDYREPE